MSVPSDGSSLTDEVRADYVSTITRVLAETDEDSERFYREPDAWVHIIDVPEGSFGALGRAMRNADIIKMVIGVAWPRAGQHPALRHAAQLYPSPPPACAGRPPRPGRPRVSLLVAAATTFTSLK
jgi:hypothetical protein